MTKTPKFQKERIGTKLLKRFNTQSILERQKAELTEETIEIILDRFPTFFDKKDVEEAEENVQKGEGVPMRKRIFSEFVMESSKDSIVYIKSDYKKMKKVWNEKHKNELYE